MEHALLMKLKQIEDCPVRGHIKMLDDTRFVFVGEDPATPDVVFLGFRNAEKKDTKIKLSREAYNALRCLIAEPFKGERVRFPYELSWGVVVIEKSNPETRALNLLEKGKVTKEEIENLSIEELVAKKKGIGIKTATYLKKMSQADN